MIRRIPAPWLVLDIVGAIVGLLITVPLSLTFSGGQLSFWMPDPPSAVMLVAVSMLLWGAAAISRLSPPIALVVAWTGALLQMAAGLPPLPLDLAIFVVLFAAAAWGTKRMMWIGGASAVGGGLIAGVYIGVLQYDFTAAVTAPSPIEMRLVLLSITMGLTIVLSLAMAWGAGLLWRLVRQSLRNDVLLRTRGTPVERDKTGPEHGRYQHPELYGQPRERGMDYHEDDEAPPVAGPETAQN